MGAVKRYDGIQTRHSTSPESLWRPFWGHARPVRTAEIVSNQNFQNFGKIVVPSLGSGAAKLGQRYDCCWKQATWMYHVMDRGKFQGRHGSGTCSTVVVLRDHLAHLAHHVCAQYMCT